ncbi:MAG: hypothetical protein ACK5HR_00555 [Mycoplasmatales bacterium]
MRFRTLVLRYNIINLVIILFVFLIYIFAFFLFKSTGLVLPILIIAMFVFPILIAIFLIRTNIAMVKKFIHKNLLHNYNANNISYNNVLNGGALTKEERDLLPNYDSIDDIKKEHFFNTLFQGELNDLRILYNIDNFEYSWYKQYKMDKFGIFRYKDYYFKFKGTAFTIEYNDIYFDNNPLIYCNNSANRVIGNGKFNLESIENFKFQNGANGFLRFNKNKTDDSRYKLILQYLYKNQEHFSTLDKMFVIFNKNRLIILTEAKHMFKINIPFILTKSKIDNIANTQKKNIYKFNIFLDKIALLFQSNNSIISNPNLDNKLDSELIKQKKLQTEEFIKQNKNLMEKHNIKLILMILGFIISSILLICLILLIQQQHQKNQEKLDKFFDTASALSELA